MNIAKYCNQSIYVLTYVDETGDAMGKGKTWKKNRKLLAHVSSKGSATVTSPDLMMNNNTVYCKLYFAEAPLLAQGERLLWYAYGHNTSDRFGVFGWVLIPQGMVMNPHQRSKMWTLKAMLHSLNNLNPDMLIV